MRAINRLSLSLLLLTSAASHPLCLNQQDPWTDGGMQFCKAGSDGKTCCSRGDEDQIKSAYYAAVGNASQTCKDLYQQYACGKCQSYASHLFATTGKLMLKDAWCTDYYNACNGALNLAGDFCAQNTRTPDLEYSYPFTPPSISTAKITTTGGGTGSNALPKVGLPSNMIAMVMRPGTNKWWVVSKSGRIVEVENSTGATYTTTVLDISSRVMSVNSEQGLLGLAFAPNFESTGAFYVHYINYDNGNSGHTVLSRFIYKSGDKDGTGNSENKLLEYNQPYANHNGGFLGFKPSTMKDNRYAPADSQFSLYFTTGDGGDHDDPGNRANNLNSYFGKVLRLAVSASGGYSYPSDNPFYPATGPKGLVYAYGLRNPWRCSFDRYTDEFWCADVGQELKEEINKIYAGKDYGWRAHEADLCNAHYNNCGFTANYQAPVASYCHNDCAWNGECVIGGYVYRGNKYPGLYGSYIFADFSTNKLGMIRPFKNYVETFKSTGLGNISAFGEDINTGELYAILMYSNQIINVGCGDHCDGRKLTASTLLQVMRAT